MARDLGYEIQDPGFKFQDSKRKVWKCVSDEKDFQKTVPDFRKPKYGSTIFLL